MRSRLFVAAFFAVVTVSLRASAQDGVLGLEPGNYLRLGAGVATPVAPQGTLRDWQQGSSFGVAYENWTTGETEPVGRIGFGLSGNLSMLPFKSGEFLQSSQGTFTTATAKDAKLVEITTTTRIRFPSVLVIPTLNLGLGFLYWSPGQITFSGPLQPQRSASQGSREGLELSIGVGVDRQLVDRYAIFADATYAYGYTGFGNGFATTAGTSACGSGSCFSTLTNTTMATVRAGLRVRVSR